MKLAVAIFPLLYFFVVRAETPDPLSSDKAAPGTFSGDASSRSHNANALIPRYEAELLYPQAGLTSDSLLFKFVVSHKHTPYVVIENFENALNNVTCSTHIANQTVLQLSFSQASMFEKANENWKRHKHLLFVTQHNSCNGPHEHGFFRSTSIRYDLTSSTILIKAQQVELGESGHASSLIRITGGLPNPELRRRLRRRRSSADLKISKREDEVSSTTLDLAQNFNPREVIFNTSSGMTLTCVDCSMEGQFNLVFNLSINTDLASSLLSSAESDVSSVASSVASVVTSDAASVVSVVTSDVASVASSVVTAAPAFVSSIASQAGSVAQGITSGAPAVISSLIGGLRLRRDIPSPQNFLQQVVQEMSVGLVQVNPVKANFNFEFVSGDQAISIPLLDLPPEGALSDVSPGPLFLGIPSTPIPLGPFQLQFTPKLLALSLTANIAPHINVTFPVSANASISQPLKLNLVAPPEGTIDPPSILVQPPIVNSIDPQLCFNLTIGPTLVARLTHLPTKTDLEVQVGLDIPKISVCFSEQTNVDNTCAPNGPIQKALEIDTTLALGLELFSKATILGVPLGNIIGSQLPDLSSLGLVHEFNLDDTCIDVNSLKIGDGGQQLPVPATFVSDTSTAIMEMSSSASAQEISTFAASTTDVEVGSSTVAVISGAESTTIVINVSTGMPDIVLEETAAAGSVRESFTGTATAMLSAATDLVEIDIFVDGG